MNPPAPSFSSSSFSLVNLVILGDGPIVFVYNAIRSAASFFAFVFFFGVPFDVPSDVVAMVGKFSAAAARSAKNRSNSVLVRLSSGPLPSFCSRGSQSREEHD